jgi:hypothetical protein
MPSMDSRRTIEDRLTPEAAEFVRFCYQRRSVGWPDLYDEMCAVASRGLFRGWGPSELAEHGVGFSLFETQALAALVSRIVAEQPSPLRARTSSPVRRLGDIRVASTEGRDARPIELSPRLAGAAAS